MKSCHMIKILFVLDCKHSAYDSAAKIAIAWPTLRQESVRELGNSTVVPGEVQNGLRLFLPESQLKYFYGLLEQT